MANAKEKKTIGDDQRHQQQRRQDADVVAAFDMVNMGVVIVCHGRTLMGSPHI